MRDVIPTTGEYIDEFGAQRVIEFVSSKGVAVDADGNRWNAENGKRLSVRVGDITGPYVAPSLLFPNS